MQKRLKCSEKRILSGIADAVSESQTNKTKRHEDDKSRRVQRQELPERDIELHHRKKRVRGERRILLQQEERPHRARAYRPEGR